MLPGLKVFEFELGDHSRERLRDVGAGAEGGIVVEHLELFVFVEEAFGEHVGDGEDCVVILELEQCLKPTRLASVRTSQSFFDRGTLGRGGGHTEHPRRPVQVVGDSLR